MAKKSSSNPNEKKEIVSATRRQVAVSAEYHHSGPIPDPITLAKYDEILPGAANRIMIMAEEQARHRKQMERAVITSRSRDSLLGIVSGFIIAMSTILSGVYVIVHGYEWGGTILGSAGLVGLVSVFIYGTRSSRKERERKASD